MHGTGVQLRVAVRADPAASALAAEPPVGHVEFDAADVHHAVPAAAAAAGRRAAAAAAAAAALIC